MLKKFEFSKYSFFKNVLLLSISRNFFETPSLDDVLLGNFTLSNSTILVKDLIRWKRVFEIFLIDDNAGDIENKNITSIKKSLYQCHTPYTRLVSSHRVLFLKFFSIYNLCFFYLHLMEACLKVTISIFYFCHSKNPPDIMKNIFNSIPIYVWKNFSC